jgi:hypothetical protein
MDWYCEGTMVDKDFLTRVEEFAEKAYQAGCEDGFESGRKVETDYWKLQ